LLKKKPPRDTSAKEEGKKIFVGGLSFSDLEGKVGCHKLKEERIKKYTQIFHKFGKVARIQGHWNAKFCFVVYSKRQDAKRAMKYLSQHPVRKSMVKQVTLKSNVVLSPSFYVRWASSSNDTSNQNTTNTDSLSNPSDMSDLCSSVSSSDDCGSSVFDSSDCNSSDCGDSVSSSECSYNDVYMLVDTPSLPSDPPYGQDEMEDM